MASNACVEWEYNITTSNDFFSLQSMLRLLVYVPIQRKSATFYSFPYEVQCMIRFLSCFKSMNLKITVNLSCLKKIAASFKNHGALPNLHPHSICEIA